MTAASKLKFNLLSNFQSELLCHAIDTATNIDCTAGITPLLQLSTVLVPDEHDGIKPLVPILHTQLYFHFSSRVLFELPGWGVYCAHIHKDTAAAAAAVAAFALIAILHLLLPLLMLPWLCQQHACCCCRCCCTMNPQLLQAAAAVSMTAVAVFLSEF